MAGKRKEQGRSVRRQSWYGVHLFACDGWRFSCLHANDSDLRIPILLQVHPTLVIKAAVGCICCARLWMRGWRWRSSARRRLQLAAAAAAAVAAAAVTAAAVAAAIAAAVAAAAATEL
jgi:hypothetical protein